MTGVDVSYELQNLFRVCASGAGMTVGRSINLGMSHLS